MTGLASKKTDDHTENATEIILNSPNLGKEVKWKTKTKNFQKKKSFRHPKKQALEFMN